MKLTAICAAALVAACAGRDPAPVPLVQPQDNQASCATIRAELAAGDRRLADLASEQGGKVAQNVAAGLVGILIWPIWFAMDLKGAASTDAAALEDRRAYLGQLYQEKRCA